MYNLHLHRRQAFRLGAADGLFPGEESYRSAVTAAGQDYKHGDNRKSPDKKDRQLSVTENRDKSKLIALRLRPLSGGEAYQRRQNGALKMSNELLVSLIAFAGTALGTFGGIIASSKMTNYRLMQLEKKVGEHNNFAQRIPVIEEQIHTINHRLKKLEEEQI